MPLITDSVYAALMKERVDLIRELACIPDMSGYEASRCMQTLIADQKQRFGWPWQRCADDDWSLFRPSSAQEATGCTVLPDPEPAREETIKRPAN